MRTTLTIALVALLAGCAAPRPAPAGRSYAMDHASCSQRAAAAYPMPVAQSSGDRCVVSGNVVECRPVSSGGFAQGFNETSAIGNRQNYVAACTRQLGW